MYCKNCNINYKKDKKVCTKCGAALLSGSAATAQEAKFKKKRQRNIIIIATAAVVILVATFLTVYLVEKVPNELYGTLNSRTWYESEGYGTIVFNPSGEMVLTMMGDDYEGSYTFDSSTDSGLITYEGGTNEFTCDGTTLSWSGSTWTLNYVEQIEYDWDSMFSGLTG